MTNTLTNRARGLGLILLFAALTWAVLGVLFVTVIL